MKKTEEISGIIKDLGIGVLIALVSIPISMGYAMVAGLPAQYGLYGSVLPILFYGIITSSKRFVFGVDAAPAALVGALLAALGIAAESEEAVRLVPVVSLVVAAWLILFYLLHADRILKFISQPVMGGFITGIGLTIILMQLPKLYGGTAGRGEMVELLLHAFEEAERGIHPLSLGLGIFTVMVILLGKHMAPKLPMHALMVFAGAGLSYFLHIEAYGVKRLPAVAPGLPEVSFPDIRLLREDFETIVLSALTIALVIFAETLLASSNLARKHEEKIVAWRELLAYAAGNLAAALCGCCPVNGSVSRSGIAGQFGVRSQWMSLSAAVSMVFVLCFGTGFIAYLPVPVLTGIVIAALIGTLEFELARRLKKVDRAEYIIFYAAMFSVLLLGTIYGVIVGVLLSSVTFIIRQSKPPTAFLGVVEGMEGFHSLTRMGLAVPIRDVVIYRFTGALFFANIAQLEEELEERVTAGMRVVIIDASGIGSVDMTAAEHLLQCYLRYRSRGLRFYIAGHVSAVNDQFRSFGAGALIDEGVVRSRISLALRDAGIEQPYPLQQDYHKKGRRFHHQLAEFAWAYGAEAEQRMRDMARQIAKEVSEKTNAEGRVDVEWLRTEEKAFAHGYWNYTDEDVFLKELEEELKLLKAAGAVEEEKIQELDSQIAKRHEQLAERIAAQRAKWKMDAKKEKR